MSTSLRSRLNDLAASFSASVLDAIRGASLEELVSDSSRGRAPAAARSTGKPASNTRAVEAAAPAPGRRGGRLSRRSSGDIAQAIDRIAGLLRDNPGGLRAEEIRQKLGLQAKELPRPIKEGLEAGRFTKEGQKRATTYFARGGVVAGKVAARAARATRATRAPRATGAPRAKRGTARRGARRGRPAATKRKARKAR